MPIALLSVFHKPGIIEFAQSLLTLNQGWEVIASDGTAKEFKGTNVPVQSVSERYKSPPMCRGRVKTLLPDLYAGLLANPVEDAEDIKKFGISCIDLVCVDLYPMEEVIRKPNATPAQVIEMTDIGGPNMLRAAAKGNRIVIGDPADRERVLKWLAEGKPDHDNFINDLAAKAEYIVAKYALASARYRSKGKYTAII